MKKIALGFAALFLLAGVLTFTGCQESDISAPVITVTNDDATHNRVEQFSAVTYTDPGATVVDDVDKDLVATAAGTVNMNSAGEYVITYTATDKALNVGNATRTVTVDGAMYLDNFTYMVTDYPDGGSARTPFAETLTSSLVTFNKINFVRFADYDNCPVYGTISGTTITIPQQTIINAGQTPADRQFTGSGTFTNNFTSFTINYTEVTNGTTATGHITYVKN